LYIQLQSYSIFGKGRKVIPGTAIKFPLSPSVSTPESSTSFILPPSVLTDGLTRTQLVFARHTGIDPRSLTLDSREYFLFMELRAEYKWQSWNIDWRKVTTHFNDANKEKHPGVALKWPKALINTLAKVEVKILERLASGNYVCKYHVRF
jgi:hypothetical protein